MLKPSPGYSTTPLMGLVEKGGTNAATSSFMASVNFCVSHVPSTIIAALPAVKSSRLLVLVRTSEFVQPLVLSAAHFVHWTVSALEFQAALPEYRSFHCATEYVPIIW